MLSALEQERICTAAIPQKEGMKWGTAERGEASALQRVGRGRSEGPAGTCIVAVSLAHQRSMICQAPQHQADRLPGLGW